MKTKELELSHKELNLILSALYVRFEEATENQDTLVGRLTNRLYDAKDELKKQNN
tara:strand:- start:1116 stop:1280 length:165 start_codon:yes stop_codon:yes gene_type:complete